MLYRLLVALADHKTVAQVILEQGPFFGPGGHWGELSNESVFGAQPWPMRKAIFRAQANFLALALQPAPRARGGAECFTGCTRHSQGPSGADEA